MQLSPSLSRRLVFAVGAASLAGCVTLLYARHVAGNPMRLFRDSEGVLRFETRRDVLESKMAVRAAAAMDVVSFLAASSPASSGAHPPPPFPPAAARL